MLDSLPLSGGPYHFLDAASFQNRVVQYRVRPNEWRLSGSAISAVGDRD